MATTDEQTDTAPDTDTDQAAETEPRPAGGTVRRSTFLVVAALAAAFAVLAVVMSIVAASLDADARDTSGDREEVAQVAGRVVDLLVSFDYADPEAARGPLAGLLTDDLLDEYENNVLPALQTSMAEVEGRAVVEVTDVFVSTVDDNEAAAVVQCDLVTSSTVAGERRLDNAYFSVTLVRGEGGWEASEVDQINFQSGGESPITQPG